MGYQSGACVGLQTSLAEKRLGALVRTIGKWLNGKYRRKECFEGCAAHGVSGRAFSQRRRRRRHAAQHHQTVALEVSCAQVLEDVFQDSLSLRRVEVKKKTRMEKSLASRHSGKVLGRQAVEEPPALQDQGRSAPEHDSGGTQESNMQLLKQVPGVGRADGFHPRLSLNLSRETCEHIVVFMCESGAMRLLGLCGPARSVSFSFPKSHQRETICFVAHPDSVFGMGCWLQWCWEKWDATWKRWTKERSLW